EGRLGLAHESRRFNMAAKRHSRRPLRALARSSPRSARGLGIAALGGSMVALALGPTAGLADTGGLYVDSHASLAAGHDVFGDTTGSDNVAGGTQALYFNSSGGDDVALGANALFYNTSGSDNIAVGKEALSANTTGHDNLASGTRALVGNTTGARNIATGTRALTNNSIGND